MVKPNLWQVLDAALRFENLVERGQRAYLHVWSEGKEDCVVIPGLPAAGMDGANVVLLVWTCAPILGSSDSWGFSDSTPMAKGGLVVSGSLAWNTKATCFFMLRLTGKRPGFKVGKPAVVSSNMLQRQYRRMNKFYNHRRIQSTLGYVSPVMFKQCWLVAQLRKAAKFAA